MPFKWENFSKTLLRELARSGGLRVSFGVEDLAKAYGEVPHQQFVQDLWPVLRDRWLGASPAPRQVVVDGLRAARLGDIGVRVGTKAGQMEYLKSCRQSVGLRAVVLREFLTAGSVDPDVAEPLRPSPEDKDTNTHLIEIAFASLDDDTCARMEVLILQGLVDALNRYGVPCGGATVAAAYLTSNIEIAISASLVNETPVNPRESEARERIIKGAARISAEHQVDDLRTAIRSFAEQGFADPEHTVSSLLMITFPTILTMIASGDLGFDEETLKMMIEEVEWVYDAMGSPTGPDTESAPTSTPPARGVEQTAGQGDADPTGRDGGGARRGLLHRLFAKRGSSESASHDVPTSAPGPSVVAPDAPPAVHGHEVTARLLEHLTQLLGHAPVVDGDGDLEFVAGSAVVYLRVLADGNSLPLLRAFSVLVRGLQPSPELYECVVKAQEQLRVGKFVTANDAVVLDITIPAGDLTVHDVDFVLSEAMGAADFFDTLLAQKFGGQMSGADVGDVIEA